MLLKIDQEFRTLIPPLTHEDRTGLENNIKANGCETPITVWGGTIIDGHNRYDICIANGIPFEVKEIHFADRDDAKVWMIRHELEWKGRKITPFIRSSLALKMEEIIKAKARLNLSLSGGDKKSEQYKEKSGVPTLANPIPPVSTRKELAKLADVSHGTLDKVKVIEKAITEHKITPEIKHDLESGKKSINEAYIEVKRQEIQKKEDEARKQRSLQAEKELQTQKEIPKIKSPEPEEPIVCTFKPSPILDKLTMCPCGCGYGIYSVFGTTNDKWYSKDEINKLKEVKQ